MSPLSSETSTDGSGGPRRGRPPRPSARAALVGVLVLAVVAAAALTVGRGGHGAQLVPAAAHSTASNPYAVHITTVVGSSIPPRQYGNELSRQQGSDTDDGGAPGATPGPPITPVSPSAFAGPTAAYRAYAERWASTLAGEVPQLRAALAAGGRAAAERQWGIAFSDYLHLGAVYGLLPGTLDAEGVAWLTELESLDAMPRWCGLTDQHLAEVVVQTTLRIVVDTDHRAGADL